MEGILPLLFNFFVRMIYVGLYPQRHVLGRAITHKVSFHESFVVAGFSSDCEGRFEPFALGLIKA